MELAHSNRVPSRRAGNYATLPFLFAALQVFDAIVLEISIPLIEILNCTFSYAAISNNEHTHLRRQSCNRVVMQHGDAQSGAAVHNLTDLRQ